MLNWQHIIQDFSEYKFVLKLLCLLIGISFTYQYCKGFDIGGFGGKVWWSNLRLVHAINYSAFAYLSYYNRKKAYLILIFDVIIGLIGFISKEL